jgi:hypothetical protein
MTYLSRFNFQLEYVRGMDNLSADALSRYPAFEAVVTCRQARVLIVTVTSGGKSHLVPLKGLELSLWLTSQVFELHLQCNLQRTVQLATLRRSCCTTCCCAHGTDHAFQTERSQFVQDTTGLWWWHGRVVVPSDAALCPRILWERREASWAGHKGIARTLELVSRICRTASSLWS